MPWSLARIHILYFTQLTPSCIAFSITAMHASLSRVVSMPPVRYDISGGIPRCLQFIMHRGSYLLVICMKPMSTRCGIGICLCWINIVWVWVWVWVWVLLYFLFFVPIHFNRLSPIFLTPGRWYDWQRQWGDTRDYGQMIHVSRLRTMIW